MASKVLISFDIEEFDLPREHGAEISLEEGVKVSAEGLEKILALCKKYEIAVTFFVTGNFAKTRPDLIKRMVKEGHEVACHGVDHFKPKASDVKESKVIVEKIAGTKVLGYRQPRMFKIDYEELKRQGYLYDSSINPAWVPGRYNHLDAPRKPFEKDGVIEIPVSVANFLRMPLFWLALHVMPLKVYVKMVKQTMKKTGYFTTYFHPWEFANLDIFAVVPGYIRKNSGDKLVGRLEFLISELKKSGGEFVTYTEYLKTCYNSKYEKESVEREN